MKIKKGYKFKEHKVVILGIIFLVLLIAFVTIPTLASYKNRTLSQNITVWDETVDESQPLELFDPRATWKRKTYTDFIAKPLQVPVFRSGELVYQQPNLQEIQKYCLEQVDTLWDEVKRFENPHTYYVDLSQKLWDIKQALLREKK